jgi:hypothetical protein
MKENLISPLYPIYLSILSLSLYSLGKKNLGSQSLKNRLSVFISAAEKKFDFKFNLPLTFEYIPLGLC